MAFGCFGGLFSEISLLEANVSQESMLFSPFSQANHNFGNQINYHGFKFYKWEPFAQTSIFFSIPNIQMVGA